MTASLAVVHRQLVRADGLANEVSLAKVAADPGQQLDGRLRFPSAMTVMPGFLPSAITVSAIASERASVSMFRMKDLAILSLLIGNCDR